jgi:hypothetical protein
VRSKQRFRRKKLLAQRKQDATAPGSEEAEVPDTDESARQNVQQKAAQEFIGRQRQEAAFVFVSGVAPAERDLILHEGNEPVIGNGNAMGVGAEVAKNLIGAAERRFAVGYPVPCIELADQTAEEFGLSQTAKQTMELELPGSMRLLERI